MDSIQEQGISFQWTNWGAINDQEYALQTVLIPETICLLIMEDMSLEKEDALDVMKQSRGFGLRGNSRVV